MSGLRKAFLLVVLATVCAGISVLVRPQARRILEGGQSPDSIEAGDIVQDRKTPTLWIDARTPEEYAAGHIPGAVLLDGENWDSAIGPVLQRWQPGVRIVVYCGDKDCDRSRRVADRLRRDYGLAPVYVLDGGISRWRGGIER